MGIIVVVNIEHFTDLVRFYLSLSDLELGRITGGAMLSYSATQLHVAGVMFKVVEAEYGKRFFGMRFDLMNKVMEISCIVLSDEKIRHIRNIIALEQSCYVWHQYVTDFFVMLDSLIKNSADVDLLCEKGILINNLVDENAAASAVNSLSTNISWFFRNPDYSAMCKELNEFYVRNMTYCEWWHEWWYEWRATLWRQYFSTPWRAASTSAAIMPLLFTAIQTVGSLKSTKW